MSLYDFIKHVLDLIYKQQKKSKNKKNGEFILNLIPSFIK